MLPKVTEIWKGLQKKSFINEKAEIIINILHIKSTCYIGQFWYKSHSQVPEVLQ